MSDWKGKSKENPQGNPQGNPQTNPQGKPHGKLHGKPHGNPHGKPQGAKSDKSEFEQFFINYFKENSQWINKIDDYVLFVQKNKKYTYAIHKYDVINTQKSLSIFSNYS